MNRMGSHPANQWRVDATHADLSRRDRPAVRAVDLAAEPQSLTIDAARSALVVVDMQNDFCSPGGYLDHRGIDVTPDRAPIAPLTALLPVLRSQGLPVVWLNWGVRPDLLNIPPSLLHAHAPHGAGPGLGERIPGGSEILRDGSWGARIVDELVPQPQDIHVTKHRFSGFWDTPLDSILRNAGVTTLFFAGVNADQCVLTTLQDAGFLGYDVIMLRDCVGTTSPDFCMQATEYNVKLLFGFLTTSAALIAGLGHA